MSSHGLPSVQACILISSFKDISLIGLGLYPYDFTLITFLKALFSIQSHEVLGIRASTYEIRDGPVTGFGQRNVAQVTVPAPSPGLARLHVLLSQNPSSGSTNG